MLTAVEERELIARAQAGDTIARDLMIERNLPLVRYHAKRYLHIGHSLTMDDLMQEGSIGMMHAIRQFDHRKGKFGTYASLWITQAIRFAIYSNWGPLKVPIWTRKYLQEFRDTRDAMAKNGEPTLDQIAKTMGVPIRKLTAIAQADATLATWHSDDGSNERLTDDDLVGESPETLLSLIFDENIDYCMECLSRLPDQDSRILRMRYGLDGDGISHTLAAIGDKLGLTRERVRQIEKQALTSLRVKMDHNTFREIAEEMGFSERDVIVRKAG